MTQQSGTQLEQIVQTIEEALLPQGFTVSSREQIRDDRGVPVAEFDIVIEGVLGSGSIRWLIECRDRPSEGPAPGSWIEQLVGRRTRFKFNKVTAVSTTGFTSGAQEYARREGIELRSVNALTPEDVSDWFSATVFHLITRHSELTYAGIEIDPDVSPEVVESLRAKLAPIRAGKLGSDAPYLIHTETGAEFSLRDAWQEVANQNSDIFRDVQPGGEIKDVKVAANYTNPQARFQIITDAGPVHVVQIKFHARVFSVEKLIPITQVSEYLRTLEKEPIARLVSFAFTIDDREVDLSFSKLASGQTVITLR